MKKRYISIVSVLLIAMGLLYTRWYYSPSGNGYEVKVTTYDALGYYMYLPGTFIYNDLTQLDWFFEQDSIYQMAGGGPFYQIHQHTNGNYVFKYFGGIALLQLPFFALAHQYALHSDYPADGFSPPYQYAIAYGNVIYGILAFLLLRIVLLRYFTDRITAITLLLVAFATNLIQYISVDSGQSHGFIFRLYILVLYYTIKWHEKPRLFYALVAGWVIGMATMARPTEAIMVLIPILWNTQTKSASLAKWASVKQHKMHAYLAGVMGFVGLLPQLLYWKYASGSFVFDVGSKWTFLNPWFRVLIGFEKGWFIYTPITVFFIWGLFKLKEYPFKKSLLWFGLLNIYIVISWWDWRYGGSYSTRALSQASGVYALGLAAFLTWAFSKKWKWIVWPVGLYLIALNLFQVYQYNLGVLHYDHMNARYYQQIYWNSNPSPAQCSLMDTDEFISNSESYTKAIIWENSDTIKVDVWDWARQYLMEQTYTPQPGKETWIEVTCQMQLQFGFGSTYLEMEYETDEIKSTKVRVFRPRAPAGWDNAYHFYFKVPRDTQGTLRLLVTPQPAAQGQVSHITVRELTP
jgi:hypothetical protein